MKLLALETATESCSVALWQDGEILERFETGARRQTALVLPMVEAVLAEAGCRLAQMDAIAFGHGPGAFTGVRVAVSVAQGLGFAIDRPLIGVSTLGACAHSAAQAHGDGDWLVAFDARMGELYLGAWRVRGSAVEPLLQDCLAAPDALPDLPGDGWRGAGSGAPYWPALQQRYPALTAWHGEVQPRAASVAVLAEPCWHRGETTPAAQAQPVYLRDRVIQGAVR